jgi:hypothetical protein
MPGLFHTSFQPGKPPRGTHTRSLTDIPYRFPLTKYSTIPNTVHVTASDPNQRHDPLHGVSFAGPQRVGANFRITPRGLIRLRLDTHRSCKISPRMVL